MINFEQKFDENGQPNGWYRIEYREDNTELARFALADKHIVRRGSELYLLDYKDEPVKFTGDFDNVSFTDGKATAVTTANKYETATTVEQKLDVIAEALNLK